MSHGPGSTQTAILATLHAADVWQSTADVAAAVDRTPRQVRAALVSLERRGLARRLTRHGGRRTYDRTWIDSRPGPPLWTHRVHRNWGDPMKWDHGKTEPLEVRHVEQDADCPVQPCVVWHPATAYLMPRQMPVSGTLWAEAVAAE